MNKLIPCVISVLLIYLPTVGKSVPDKIVLEDTTVVTNIETVEENPQTIISIGVCKLSAYCKENRPHYATKHSPCRASLRAGSTRGAAPSSARGY